MEQNNKQQKQRSVGGYDDPTTKKLNQLGIVTKLNDNMGLIDEGFSNIFEIINKSIGEDELIGEISPIVKDTYENVHTELVKVLGIIKKFYMENLSSPTEFDLVSKTFNDNSPKIGDINLNEKEETIFEWKVNRNINRINEIMSRTK